MTESLRLFGRLARKPRPERRALIRAAAALIEARVMLRLRPLERLLPPPAAEVEVLDSGNEAQAQEVKRALAAAARHLPGGASCLHRALAAHRLMRGHGIAAYLFIGFRADETGAARGHAWVRHNDLIVCGAPIDGYAVASVHRIGA